MENHGLGTHNDKMCAEISIGNTKNTPKFIRPICPNRPIIWDILKFSSHVHCPCLLPNKETSKKKLVKSRQDLIISAHSTRPF